MGAARNAANNSSAGARNAYGTPDRRRLTEVLAIAFSFRGGPGRGLGRAPELGQPATLKPAVFMSSTVAFCIVASASGKDAAFFDCAALLKASLYALYATLTFGP